MEIHYEPQEGKQKDFLNTNADIAVYGGSAGGGKTYALLLECARYINRTDIKDFNACIFRRTSVQITATGGLWDSATAMFQGAGEMIKSPRPTIKFPNGVKISFSHLNQEDTVYDWQGSQICFLGFDELTHFTESQFFYMLSRNRSTCGVKPYVRATCNPDPDSWVKKLISWWLDKDTGYAIPERSGIIRYFARRNNEMLWADTPEQLKELDVSITDADIKSFTFISASIYDNKILLATDTGYLANLNSLNKVFMERLKNGNWNIRPSAGMYFNRNNVTMVEAIPVNVKNWCRAWDLASTEVSTENPNPDATAGVLIGRCEDGKFIIADVIREQAQANTVRKIIYNTAVSDKQKYGRVKIRVPQDPGQAGKEQAQSYTQMLAGFNIECKNVSGSKEVRAEPLSNQWQAGNILVLAGDWNDSYFSELEGFPDGEHDDRVDASSDAFNECSLQKRPMQFNLR